MMMTTFDVHADDDDHCNDDDDVVDVDAFYFFHV